MPFFEITSSMNWCEPDYHYTSYIAEFYNTMSSIPVALFGLHGLIHIVSTFKKQQNKNNTNNITSLGVINAMLHLMCMIVGIGSIAFHSTLTWQGQALDEVMMIWVSSSCLFAIHRISTMMENKKSMKNNNRKKPFLQDSNNVGYLLLALNVIITYVYFRQGFILFFVTYTLTVAAMLILSISYLRREERKGTFTHNTKMKHRAILATAIAIYVGGFLLLWVPEVIMCGNRLYTQHYSIFTKLHFHALFHLTSAVGSYAWCVFAAYAESNVKVQIEEDEGKVKDGDRHVVEIVSSASWSSLYVPLPKVVVVEKMK